MKKSLSLLVAIAMVFSMFASVVSADASSAGAKLQDLGVIKGDQNGDLMEDATWKRQDLAVLLSRLLGVEEEAADAAKTHTFEDVPEGFYDGYVSWAKEEGYMEGHSATDFGFGETLTNQQFYAVVLRALGVDTTGDNYANTIDLAVEAGIVAEGVDAKADAKRGETYVAIETALDTEVAGTGKKLGEILGFDGYAPEVPAAAAKAVGAKKIEVSFNKAVDDTKAAFTVKRGTITLNVASKSFNADKTVATLELSSKLTNGDYTVAVAGVEEGKDLTASFSAEDEKVTTIEFKSENAPLVDGNDGDTTADDLSIPYQVLNQYGENITKFTSLNQNIGVLDSTNGNVNIDGTYKVNDVVAVTLVHAQTATSAVKTFTVVPEARVAEVAISGLYNKDNKTINEDTNLGSEEHYLLVEAKDQYGNAVSSTAKLNADLIINETNSGVVDAAATFSTVTIDGSNKTALRLGNPASQGSADIGSTTVTLISNTTGKNASFTITVSEATRSDVINLVNPGIVVEDEDMYIPVEVFDKNGNAVTDLSALNNATKGVKVTFNGVTLSNAFVKKDGLVQIKVPSGTNTDKGIKTVIAQTSSLKLATLQLDVKEAAVPTVIRGFDGDFSKARLLSQAITVNHTNLVVEDQYGRVMDDAKVKAWLDLDLDRKIAITEDAGSTVLTFSGLDIQSNGSVVASITMNTGAAKGSEKITLTLHGDNGQAITSSAVDQTIVVTDGTEYASYSVDAVGTVYDEAAASKTDAAAYDKQVKVYGVLSNGGKIQLTNGTDYVVRALTNETINTDLLDGTLNVTSNLNFYGDKSEVVVPISVFINKNGQELKQDVTFSKAAPKVSSVKFVEQGAGVDGGAKTEYTLATADMTDSNADGNVDQFAIAKLIQGTTPAVAGALFDVIVTDQYGAKVEVTSNGTFAFADTTAVTAVTVTVTPVSGDITITGNGTSGAVVSGIDNYEAFDVTVSYGGAATTMRVSR